MKSVRPRGVDSAKVIQVVETKALRGNGTDDDPCRCVIQYWSFEGHLLAEEDLWTDHSSRSALASKYDSSESI